MLAHPATNRTTAPALPRLPVPSWTLPPQGLAVFHGPQDLPRLSHYFLPRLLLAGRPVLYLDGANAFDPLLVARFARRRGLEPQTFNRHLRIARAFTCFQLTELLERTPRLLRQFPARLVFITALPELYFDEDVREPDAVASFRHALTALRCLQQSRLTLAVFTDVEGFQTPRRRFFRQLAAQADQVMRFDRAAGFHPALPRTPARLPLAG